MPRIILDFGSGNTCKNDWDYAKRMIDELKAVDTGKHEIIIKWQLFLEAGENIPLDRDIFLKAYAYALELGYQTTSSVFDKESLDFLLRLCVPFVKIANNRALDWLIGEVPRKMPIVISLSNSKLLGYRHIYYAKCVEKTHAERMPDIYKDYCVVGNNDETKFFVHPMCCVSSYPAKIKNYEENFSNTHLKIAISDHTENFELWKKYKPLSVEWHYGLSDSTGLDAGPFMRTPEMLKEIL